MIHSDPASEDGMDVVGIGMDRRGVFCFAALYLKITIISLLDDGKITNMQLTNKSGDG